MRWYEGAISPFCNIPRCFACGHRLVVRPVTKESSSKHQGASWADFSPFQQHSEYQSMLRMMSWFGSSYAPDTPTSPSNTIDTLSVSIFLVLNLLAIWLPRKPRASYILQPTFISQSLEPTPKQPLKCHDKAVMISDVKSILTHLPCVLHCVLQYLWRLGHTWAAIWNMEEVVRKKGSNQAVQYKTYQDINHYLILCVYHFWGNIVWNILTLAFTARHQTASCLHFHTSVRCISCLAQAQLAVAAAALPHLAKH